MSEYDDIANQVAMQVADYYEKEIVEMKRVLKKILESYNDEGCTCVRCTGIRESIEKILN